MKPLTIMQSSDNSIRLIQYGNQNLKLEKYDGKIWVALLAPFQNVGEAIQAFRETTKTTTQADHHPDLRTEMKLLAERYNEDDMDFARKPTDWQTWDVQDITQYLLSCLAKRSAKNLDEYDAPAWRDDIVDACLEVGVDANGLDVSQVDANQH